MLITIFFMIASAAVIIATAVYVKKKNVSYTLRPHESRELKKKKKDIKTIWGIDVVKDGILTIDGSHSIIIELSNIEYRLLNEEEQNNIDNSLIKIAKTFKNQTQFFSTIESIDTSDKIEQIRNNIDKQKSNAIRQYGEGIIEYLESIMQEERLYVRKNYLIVTSNDSFEKAQKELEEFYNELKYNLSNIKINTKHLSDMDAIELIYRELNKNSDNKIRNLVKEGGLDFYVEATGKK